MWLTEFIGKAVSRLFPKKKLEERLGIQIASSARMETAIGEWMRIYRNEATWLGGDGDVRSMNLAAAVASEFSRLILTEFTFEMGGNERADFIGDQIKKYLLTHFNTKVEYWGAFGGIVLKPYVAGEDPVTGKPNRIPIDLIEPDRFFPTAYDDDGNVTGGLFLDIKVIGNRMYTRVEHHDQKGNVCTIKNIAYESGTLTDIGAGYSTQNQFAKEVPLSTVPDWEGIQEFTEITGVTAPIFVYIKVPLANTVDTDSPLGVSVFSRGVDGIREADKQFTRLLWEFEAKEAAVDVDETMFKMDANGNPILPKGKERTFRNWELDGSAEKIGDRIQAYSPEIREESHIKGLNRILRNLEFNCALAYGTLSDPEYIEKTAEEVKSSKQRSYDAVNLMQAEWDKGIDRLIEVMNILCDLYDIVPAGPCEKTCTWGDGILEDTDKEFQRRWAMVQAGKYKTEKFFAYYFGCSEEEARELIPDQSPIPGIE